VIDQRRGELRAQDLARLEIVGKPAQHAAELTAFGADRDQAAVELGEGTREARQCGRQRLAGGDLLANRRKHARRARLIGLLGDGGKGLVERHAGRNQRRELARQ